MKISKLCSAFLTRNGTIQATVTGGRVHSALEQGGLDIPCMFTFVGERRMVLRLKRCLLSMDLHCL